MRGTSPSSGISQALNRGGEFRSAEFGASTWENMKLVSPITSTFRTTPTITWSTK